MKMTKPEFRKSPSLVHRHCPICNYTEGYVLHRLSFALFDDNPMPRETNVVSCAHCGFIYYDTLVTEYNLQAFYKRHYMINAYDFLARYPPVIRYNREMAGIIKGLGLQFDAKITDVGCGPGHLLESIWDEGYRNLCGVELCRNYIQCLKAKGMDAVFGSALSLPESTRGSQCFVYKWVFEHLLDLHQPIISLADKISDGGLVILEVPDTSSYDLYDNFKPLNHFIIEHINHFSVHHLAEVFSLYGFKFVRSYKRLFDQNELFMMPQLCVIFEYDGKHEKRAIASDFTLAIKAEKWFIDTPAFYRNDLEIIRRNNTPVHLWGLSYRTLMHLSMGTLAECNVVGLYDKDPEKQKKFIDEKAVKSPDLLMELPDSAVVVIGIGPSSTFMREHLISAGFNGRIIML
jgi:hypothetical protein